ncbi:hypothetical protein SDC9_94456 [bioreactor metagenome]|uniref:Uncharacterized protein n=1 Tax=bioreactor metagenome TaxID=1076179 RepID=A0A645A3W6_9ZZZZ
MVGVHVDDGHCLAAGPDRRDGLPVCIALHARSVGGGIVIGRVHIQPYPVSLVIGDKALAGEAVRKDAVEKIPCFLLRLKRPVDLKVIGFDSGCSRRLSL